MIASLTTAWLVFFSVAFALALTAPHRHEDGEAMVYNGFWWFTGLIALALAIGLING